MESCTCCGGSISGEAYYENPNSPLCWKCYCRTQLEKQIHTYGYRPKPVFYGSDCHFFEVELVLCGDTSGVKACQIMRKANLGRELLYCKAREKSGEGLVLVSYPMSLDFLLRTMPWKDIFSEIWKLGYRVCKIQICCIAGVS